MKRPCKRCNGTGVEPDQAETGMRIRKLREALSISSQEMAKKMGLSASFYSELEKGIKAWSSDRIRECERILNQK